jgi:DnaK suppressor protein
LNGAC